MEQFNLQTWIENKNRQIVTRDGRQVRIICWDAKNSKPIVALVLTRSISQRQFDELPISYFNDGTYYGGAKDDFLDLFFADEEKTNKILDELKSYLEKTPKEQVEKDWKEIQDWYAQHFTNEKHNEKEELTEFEKELINAFNDAQLHTASDGEVFAKKYKEKLLDLARKQIEETNVIIEKEKYLTICDQYYNNGKKEALKDFLKWKRSNSFFNTGNKFELGKTSLRRFDGYEIPYSELEKLPNE